MSGSVRNGNISRFSSSKVNLVQPLTPASCSYLDIDVANWSYLNRSWGVSGGLLYCIWWLLVTSHCQKGQNSNAHIF